MAEEVTKIKCGQIIFLRNIWKLNYICEFCGDKLVKHKEFLSHIKEHIINLEFSKAKETAPFSEESLKLCNSAKSVGSLRPEPEIEDNHILKAAEKESLSNDTLYEGVRCDMGNLDVEFPRTSSMNRKITNAGATATIEDSTPNKSPQQDTKKFEKRETMCDMCGKIFTQSINFRVHYNRHLNIQPYSCAICGKKAASSTDIKRHMLSHTDEKPFKCDQCDSSYKLKHLLIHHQRRHTNERPFECQHCEKRFFSNCALKDHLSSHVVGRTFACVICSKPFPRKKALATHMKIHSDVKQYKCQYCSKEFHQYPGLYSHMKSHKKRGDDCKLLI